MYFTGRLLVSWVRWTRCRTRRRSRRPVLDIAPANHWAHRMVALIAQAEEDSASSTQLFGYTSTIVEHTEPGERVQIVELLWDVAYADGVLHDLEASLVRRIAGLLYVTDKDSGAARQRVLDRYGLSRA